MRSEAAAVPLFVVVVVCCACSPRSLETCAAAVCPCLLAEDCPPAHDCVDDVCVRRRQVPDATVDVTPDLKGFGELCLGNDECTSGYCLPDIQGAFCSVLCQAGCPTGWSCRLVPDPRGEKEYVGLCVRERSTLCRPCARDIDCGLTGGDLCVAQGDELACGRDCTFEGCPSGYACQEVERLAGSRARQCLPVTGTCICVPGNVGLTRGCQAVGEQGMCSGQELCESDGWSACSAAAPELESCNGQDDDCDGQTDEGLADRPCQKEAGGWVCRGLERCRQGAWTCDAQEPEIEVCDGLDNNCDGQVDEDFVDAEGVYDGRSHCGGCGVDCDLIMAQALATECRVEDGWARCSALSCVPGYYLQPTEHGTTLCLAVPDNLCTWCSRDLDCLAPGSLCLDTADGKFCGRDCGPGSIYGETCPTGYRCDRALLPPQCRPAGDSCLCDGSREGAIRACHVDSCTGYQYCRSSGQSWEWGICDLSWTVEICDGLDNNCDQEIDEGFLNPLTGRYEDDRHCGFCNNDCTQIWSPEVHHATGACTESAGLLDCRLQCTREEADGVLYEWINVNGRPDDGCECRRQLGQTADPPDLGDVPAPWSVYVDENCDGIDGVIGDALFVSASASEPGDGSLERPYRTITQALVAFPGSERRYILIAEGLYSEGIDLFDGVELYGGYAADFHNRDILLHATIVESAGLHGPAVPATIHAIAVGAGTARTVVSGIHVRGTVTDPETSSGEPGEASYAVYMLDCGPLLVLQANLIIGARGGPGGAGRTGAPGHGRQDSLTLDGREGQPTVRLDGPCPDGLWRTGGAGGTNSQCGGGSASVGGGTGCPLFSWTGTPYLSSQAEYVNPAGRDGPGGFDWSFDRWSGAACSHVTESGWPSEPRRNVGIDGIDGNDGSAGSGGQGCLGAAGSISGSGWVFAPDVATAGRPATPGQPGGGGGGAGGTQRWYRNGADCDAHEQGATGGGGAAGGCGGAGGEPAGPGGASIGVFVGYTTPPRPGRIPSIVSNRVERARGGVGGTGGYGGPGGQGGRGGFGGEPTTWVGAMGGKGGDGGNGGQGGGGGGGCGGPSFGILGFNLVAPDWQVFNEFVFPDEVLTGGVGGTGGGGAAGGSGGDGLAGWSANTWVFQPCSGGTACASGTRCDANAICVPVFD